MYDGVHQSFDGHRRPKIRASVPIAIACLTAEGNELTIRVRRDGEVRVRPIHSDVDIPAMNSSEIWLRRREHVVAQRTRPNDIVRVRRVWLHLKGTVLTPSAIRMTVAIRRDCFPKTDHRAPSGRFC